MGGSGEMSGSELEIYLSKNAYMSVCSKEQEEKTSLIGTIVINKLVRHMIVFSSQCRHQSL